MSDPNVTLALGLLMTAPHDICNVIAVLQSYADALQAGRPIPKEWDASFWRRQAERLKKSEEQVSKARDALRKVR